MKHELRVGFTVIAGILLLYGMIAWVNRIHFFAPEEENYDILFADVSGLLEGDPVSVRGYVAGRVLNIQPDNQAVRVSVSIDKKIAIKSDAYAEIRLKELMGGKQIAVFPGIAEAILPTGTELPGQASLDFASAFSRMGQLMDQVDVQQLGQLITSLDSFTQTMSTMGQALDRNALIQLPGQLAQTLTQVDALLQEVNSRNLLAQTESSMRQADSLLTHTQAAVHTLEALAQTAEEQTLPQVDSLMQRSFDMLNSSESMLLQMETLLTDLQRDDSFAGRMLRDPAFANQVDSTLKHLDEVLVQIKEERIYVAIKLGKRKKK